MNGPVVGQMVLSRAGRDSGRYFVVVALLEEGYVAIADGDLRRLASPKRKKIKHLQMQDSSWPLLSDPEVSPKRLQDAQLRNWLCEMTAASGNRE